MPTELIDATLPAALAWTVVCACGWTAGGHATPMAATAAVREHQTNAHPTYVPSWRVSQDG